MKIKIIIIYTVNLLSIIFLLISCSYTDITINNISPGWASNSINTVIFRHNSLFSHNNYQYAAFYNEHADVVLASRELMSNHWKIHKTRYKGNVKDAHNSISIMLDGDGYLHMAWDQHNSPLHYCRSKHPHNLELTEQIPMTGSNEKNVTYPEFYRLPEGNLIFLYRDGESGDGNLMINHYNTETKKWSTLHKKLISGKGQRNAYWQGVISGEGTIHISWVWRETWDVATNHDICYAKSPDGGKTWQKSTGEKYTLPITAGSAEYAVKIPQGHDLINQTSIYTDSQDYPYISSYWTPAGIKIPQYHMIYNNGNNWKILQVSNRSTGFKLGGGGTKKIPISRPQILLDAKDRIYLLFRDIERNNRVSVAICNDLLKNKWLFRDLTSFSVNMWEPSYDTELWKSNNILHLFIQKVSQEDEEKLDTVPPQMISVLEWNP